MINFLVNQRQFFRAYWVDNSLIDNRGLVPQKINQENVLATPGVIFLYDMISSGDLDFPSLK